jgi:hypothetical protein
MGWTVADGGWYRDGCSGGEFARGAQRSRGVSLLPTLDPVNLFVAAGLEFSACFVCFSMVWKVADDVLVPVVVLTHQTALSALTSREFSSWYRHAPMPFIRLASVGDSVTVEP